jgi:hypothetical protein
LAIEKFHCDELLTILLADIVNRADIRMAERRSRLRLPPESFERLRVVRQIFGKELQGDGAIEPRIFGLVNDTHPTATEFFKNAIVRDGLANHGWKDALEGAC